MVEFYVNIDKMNTIATELDSCGKRIRKEASGVDQVKNNIDMGANAMTREYVKSLIILETDILAKAVMAENLCKALKYIGERYLASENMITSSAGNPITMGLQIFISQAITNLLGALGLDDDYYRAGMGYEGYDAEKKQEYLMDHYLSEKFQEMLKDPRYSEETWKNASTEEKKQMLQNFLVEINEYMGTNADTTIEFKDLGENTRGQYYNNKITINIRYITDKKPEDSYMIMRTMIHEMRHCYQHSAVDNPDQYLVSQETRNQWEYNFNHYKSKGDAYFKQPIEWDAKNFAGQKGDVKGVTPDYRGSW